MDEPIEFRKKLNQYISRARENAKLDYCYYCEEPSPIFCISHSVPKFCLKLISSGETLLTLNSFLKLPFENLDKGANEAGTFKIICRECDNKIFREYEKPDSYQTVPTDQMLAQIAMKNYLQLIGKRNIELALSGIALKDLGADHESTSYNNRINSLDRRDFDIGFQRAKLGGIKDRAGWYYLCFYQKLKYQIPLAFQAAITLINDLDGNVINDIFSLDPSYRTSQIHIAAFPFPTESVVLAFVDSRDNRYRTFYKQIRKLPPEDQLAVINFIIFGYSENVYISKLINKQIFENNDFIEVCGLGIVHPGPIGSSNRLSIAVSRYDLSKRVRIPNLLSEDYCLTSED